jgi:hypothetical protein
MDMTNVPLGEKYCELIALIQRNRLNFVIWSAVDMVTDITSHVQKQTVHACIPATNSLIPEWFDVLKVEKK